MSDISASSGSMNRRAFLVTSAAAAAATSATRVASGQSATPVGSESPVASPASAGPQVVVSGLHDPRYLATDGQDVYFTEAGTGGDTEVWQTVGDGTPAPAAPVSRRGTTGALSVLRADGTVEPVADGFVSYTFGQNGEIVGAAGVALDGDGKAFVSVGAPGPFISQIELTGDENAIFEVDLASGDKRRIAELSTHEIQENPDPMTVDSNLYGLAIADGTAYVADSGGNDIVKVGLADGAVSTFAVTGGLAAPFLPDSGNPMRQGAKEIDSVPAGCRIGPDGRIYVTYVTGGPFPVGLARIDAFSMDGSGTPFAEGLSMTTDIAWSSDGTAYACIMSSNFLENGPGQIVRLTDGDYRVVVDGLMLPNSIVFDADDTLYIVNKSSFAPEGGGEILRVEGVTTADGLPFTGAATPHGTPAASPVAAVSVDVELGDMYFKPAEFSIPANTDVLIRFRNVGFLPHDMYIQDKDETSPVIAGGETGEFTINLPPGKHVFWCTQVGHRQAGMEGTITAQ